MKRDGERGGGMGSFVSIERERTNASGLLDTVAEYPDMNHQSLFGIIDK